MVRETTRNLKNPLNSASGSSSYPKLQELIAKGKSEYEKTQKLLDVEFKTANQENNKSIKGLFEFFTVDKDHRLSMINEKNLGNFPVLKKEKVKGNEAKPKKDVDDQEKREWDFKKNKFMEKAGEEEVKKVTDNKKSFGKDNVRQSQEIFASKKEPEDIVAGSEEDNYKNSLEMTFVTKTQENVQNERRMISRRFQGAKNEEIRQRNDESEEDESEYLEIEEENGLPKWNPGKQMTLDMIIQLSKAVESDGKYTDDELDSEDEFYPCSDEMFGEKNMEESIEFEEEKEEGNILKEESRLHLKKEGVSRNELSLDVTQESYHEETTQEEKEPSHYQGIFDKIQTASEDQTRAARRIQNPLTNTKIGKVIAWATIVLAFVGLLSSYTDAEKYQDLIITWNSRLGMREPPQGFPYQAYQEFTKNINDSAHCQKIELLDVNTYTMEYTISVMAPLFVYEEGKGHYSYHIKSNNIVSDFHKIRKEVYLDKEFKSPSPIYVWNEQFTRSLIDHTMISINVLYALTGKVGRSAEIFCSDAKIRAEVLKRVAFEKKYLHHFALEKIESFLAKYGPFTKTIGYPYEHLTKLISTIVSLVIGGTVGHVLVYIVKLLLGEK